MTAYELYIFILCLIVFIMLSGVFSFMITLLIRMHLRLIRCGQEDVSITEEHKKKQELQSNKKKLLCPVIEKILSASIAVILCVALVFSIYVNVNDSLCGGKISTLKVVKSSSMSLKRESNKYLFENALDDQIQMFDIIRVHPAPAEDELELFDIVVYEINGDQVIHRIVGIEEPDEKHPNCRYFLLQGDAVHYPDTFPVLYSQIKAIYRGERISNVGSFIMFMQTPPGWLCVLLILAYLIVEPIISKKLKEEQALRLAIIDGERETELGENTEENSDANTLSGGNSGENQNE